MAHARIEPSEPPTTPPAVNYSLPDDPDLALKEVADFWSPGVKDDELQDRLEAFANNLDTMTAAWAASLTRDYPAKLWPNLYGTICEALKAVADTPEPEVSDFSMWLVIEIATSLARAILPHDTSRVANWRFGTVSVSNLGGAIHRFVQACRGRRNNVPPRFAKSRTGTVAAKEMMRLQVEGEIACRSWGFVLPDGTVDPVKLAAYNAGDIESLAVPDFSETRVPTPGWPRAFPGVTDLLAALADMSRRLLY